MSDLAAVTRGGRQITGIVIDIIIIVACPFDNSGFIMYDGGPGTYTRTKI